MKRTSLPLHRREVITLLGGAASGWPLAARAQQGERVRRIGVLMSVADGQEGQARLGAFLKALEQLGWTDGRNVRIDQRWGAGDAERARRYAAELVALGPDVILILLPDGLPQAQEREDEHDHNDQADEINQPVHGATPFISTSAKLLKQKNVPEFVEILAP